MSQNPIASNQRVRYNKQASRSRFGERLERYCMKRGVTQTELADQIGLSPSGVNKYMSGERNPTSDFVIQVTRILDLNEEEAGALVWSYFADVILDFFKTYIAAAERDAHKTQGGGL